MQIVRFSSSIIYKSLIVQIIIALQQQRKTLII